MRRRKKPLSLREEAQWRCLLGKFPPPQGAGAKRRRLLLHRYRRSGREALHWLVWAEQESVASEPSSEGRVLGLLDEGLWLYLRERRWPETTWCQRAVGLLRHWEPEGEAERVEKEWKQGWLERWLEGGPQGAFLSLYAQGRQEGWGSPRSRLLWGLWLAWAMGDEEEWHRLRENTLASFQRAVPLSWLPSWRVEVLREVNREWTRQQLESLRRSAAVFPLWRSSLEAVLTPRRLRLWQQRLRWVWVQRHPVPLQAWRETLEQLRRQERAFLPRPTPGASEFERLLGQAVQLVGEIARTEGEAARRLRQVEALLPKEWEWLSSEDFIRLAQFSLWLGEAYLAADLMAEVREWETFFAHFGWPKGPSP